MITILALRALVVLVAIPGLPRGLPGLGKLIPRHHKAAPRDTIPPVWKPASRLALEDRFVHRNLAPLTPRRVGLKVQMGLDPRQFFVSIDPDSGTITSGTRLGEVPLGPQAMGSLTEYSRQATREAFQEAWRQTSLRNLNTMQG